MHNYLFSAFLFCNFSCLSMMYGQDLMHIEGQVRIEIMDTVQENGHLIVRQGDMTLALSSSPAVKAVQSPVFLPLAPGFEFYGQGYEIGMVYEHKGRVYLGGLLRKSSGTIGLNDVLFTLPPGYRPAQETDIYGMQKQEVVHLKIQADGLVRVASDPVANTDWVSIDGLNFYIP